MDADRFGKEMIAKLIIKLGLPIDTAKENLGLSGYIENYPLTSKMVLSQLKMIIDSIKQIKKSVYDNLLDKDNSLLDMAGFYINEIIIKDYMFDRKEKVAEKIKEISLNDIKHLSKNFYLPRSQKR